VVDRPSRGLVAISGCYWRGETPAVPADLKGAPLWKVNCLLSVTPKHRVENQTRLEWQGQLSSVV